MTSCPWQLLDGKLSYHTRNRRPLINPKRPPLHVVKLRVRADAKQVVNRRGEVGRGVRVAGGHTAMLVGAADDLAGPNAAAGEEAREHVAPVVPARREDFTRGIATSGGDRRDARRPAHLATHDN